MQNKLVVAFIDEFYKIVYKKIVLFLGLGIKFAYKIGLLH